MERLFATPKMKPFLSLSIKLMMSSPAKAQREQRKSFCLCVLCGFAGENVLSCCTLRCSHERFVLATLDPLQDFRHAPDRKRMAQPGGDHVRPETIQRFLVVVLLEV